MIKIEDKSKCCGCSACLQVCPAQCLYMEEDVEGFLYPKCVTEKCLNCGLCEKVCPVNIQEDKKMPSNVYAVKNKNDDQRLLSSSGGVFVMLAEYVIKHGGVVFGARFDENWEVEHCSVDTLDEIKYLMRSKYVQSRIGRTYQKVKNFLIEGKTVLFIGTSCQIAGLKSFLRKNYDNLLAVDLVCHGVPSPSIWRNYLKGLKESIAHNLEKRSGILNSNYKITDINFREKQKCGFSWKKFGFVIYGAILGNEENKTVLYSVSAHKDSYLRAFFNNLTLRPICYDCFFKSGKCHSDLTLADYWGIAGLIPCFDDDKGVSLVFVNSDNGKKLLDNIDVNIIETSLEHAVKNNIAYEKSVERTSKRDIFWSLLNHGIPFNEAVKKVCKQSVYSRIKKKASYLFRGFIHRYIIKYKK